MHSVDICSHIFYYSSLLSNIFDYPTVFGPFFLMARQPLGGLGRLIFSRLHDHTLDTPHSVALFWTRDQLVAETST
jgi:hypothetical protein